MLSYLNRRIARDVDNYLACVHSPVRELSSEEAAALVGKSVCEMTINEYVWDLRRRERAELLGRRLMGNKTIMSDEEVAQLGIKP